MESTLIIVTSDHGMPFPRCKGNAYAHSNHVPLAAMWKNGIRGKGRTVSDYVFSHARILAGEEIETRWLNPGDFEKDAVARER